MILVLISPPAERPDEAALLGRMLEAGLARYHVRKPQWDEARLQAWLGALPAAWRPHLVLHGHPALAVRLGLGGAHWRDEPGAPENPRGVVGGLLTSRSCHDLGAVERAAGRYDSVFLGPVYPSLSKPGLPASPTLSATGLGDLPASGRRGTVVLALGGITTGRLAGCRRLGFDGAAALGAVWGEADPAAAFRRLRDESVVLGRGLPPHGA